MSITPPVCACTNEGRPWILNGVEVVSRSPSCRVHVTYLSPTNIQLSAETIVGNWKDREDKHETMAT